MVGERRGLNTHLSHAGFNERCHWKKTLSQDRNYLETEDHWEGVFYAKEEFWQRDEQNSIGGSYRFSRATITISTVDYVDGIDYNDVVLFRGEKWRIQKVERHTIRTTSEFQTTPDCKTYLELRK